MVKNNAWTEDWLALHMAKRAKIAEEKHEPDEGPESKLQAKIVEYCKDHGYPCLSFPQSKKLARYLYPGWPDLTILAVDQKRVLLIELKDKKGRQSEAQKRFMTMSMFAGQEYHVVRSFKRFVDIIGG